MWRERWESGSSQSTEWMRGIYPLLEAARKNVLSRSEEGMVGPTLSALSVSSFFEDPNILRFCHAVKPRLTGPAPDSCAAYTTLQVLSLWLFGFLRTHLQISTIGTDNQTLWSHNEGKMKGYCPDNCSSSVISYGFLYCRG